MLCAAVTVLLALGTPGAVSSNQLEPYEPEAVVEQFLLARGTGDVHAAATWLAPLLELQDVDGQWFIDTPTATDWLWQLGERYALEVVEPPRSDVTAVVWTERLERRDAVVHDPWGFSMTIEVRAVVRDGRITYLSGGYPPIPLRPTIAAEAAPERSDGTPVGSPVTLFAGSALGVAATYAGVGLAPKLIRNRRRSDSR
jgi:hypothetical protein